MALTVPDLADAALPYEAGIDSVDIDIIVAAFNRTGVISGCAVTQRAAGANDSVDVAAGTVMVAGTEVAVTGTNVVVTAAHATLARVDLVVVSNAGVVSVVAGTAADPTTSAFKAPPIPANSVVLAFVYRAPADASVTTNRIIDKRMTPLPRWVLTDIANIFSKGGQRINRDADVVALALRKFASGDTTAFLAFENEVGTTISTVNNAGRFAGPAGAAGTPTFGFQAGAGDGMYRIGTGIVGFAAGSAERLRLSATLAQFAAGIVLTADNVKRGAGSPEGAVTGSVGDAYERTDGGSGTSLYVKESGTATNTGWVAHGRGSHSKYDEVHATTQVVNTVTQTDLYSKSIAGGDMPAGALFRLVAWGDQLNNSGAGQTYTYRVKLGATTILQTANFSAPSSASRRKWTLEVWILGESSTAQRIGGRLTVSDIPGGTETMPQAQTLDFQGSNTSAEDTSTAKTLAVTIAMGTAGASIDTRLLGAVLERVS